MSKEVWEKNWDKETKEIKNKKQKRLHDFLIEIGLFESLTEVIEGNFSGDEGTFYKSSQRYGCHQDLAAHLIEQLENEMFEYETDQTVNGLLEA
ncbi:hypothetical protein UFOVP733_37 [uncultured Caudovirales phage]|uniref:Uncharacterized protein n=1 Tax=uncultured Caudovirales phage TaxID=2100421 RepID=A0A6J5NQJ1_9CAUD|nr:hypothetical protein UFOVP733_37 [uncultured Caudovirales phage]CAB5224875.1 hypothetical protein UFOVP743_22 [uncultured Caudovirales phage]